MKRIGRCIDKKEGLRLVEYEQGWMTPAAAQAFARDHLARCAACRQSLAFFQPIWTTLRRHPWILDGGEDLARGARRWRRSALAS